MPDPTAKICNHKKQSCLTLTVFASQVATLINLETKPFQLMQPISIAESQRCNTIFFARCILQNGFKKNGLAQALDAEGRSCCCCCNCSFCTPSCIKQNKTKKLPSAIPSVPFNSLKLHDTILILSKSASNSSSNIKLHGKNRCNSPPTGSE
jgi:hypothetical protein